MHTRDITHTPTQTTIQASKLAQCTKNEGQTLWSARRIAPTARPLSPGERNSSICFLRQSMRHLRCISPSSVFVDADFSSPWFCSSYFIRTAFSRCISFPLHSFFACGSAMKKLLLKRSLPKGGKGNQKKVNVLNKSNTWFLTYIRATRKPETRQ